MNWERQGVTNRGRRSVLRGIASAAAVAVGVGSATASGSTTAEEHGPAAENRPVVERLRQQVDTTLPPGVTLFDLSGDGAHTATVEQAAPKSGSGHSDAIHVSSGGSSTVDYATSVAEPPSGTTLGDLSDLSYDYFEGADNVNPDADGGGFAPDETFVVVENSDGRHGMYLTYNDDAAGNRGDQQWLTFDVLARMQGDTAGTDGWFEYTKVEEGYSGRTFSSVVERFGADAQLVRVGTGHGNAVNPATLDLYYDNLTIGGQTLGFPSKVVKRTS